MRIGVGVAIVFAALFNPRTADARQGVEVILGSDLSIAGGEAYLPLMLTTSGVRVATVTSEISFPKEVLSFLETRRGEAVDQSDAEVKAEVKEGSGDSEYSVLAVTISAENGLPGGLLVTLKFQISTSAKETDIKLKNSVKVKTLKGEEVPEARGNEATLTISPARLPEVGCFFFTH